MLVITIVKQSYIYVFTNYKSQSNDAFLENYTLCDSIETKMRFTELFNAILRKLIWPYPIHIVIALSLMQQDIL